MNGRFPPKDMGILRAEWRIHACELDDIALIQKSLEWLSGIDDCVVWKKDKSFHGPPISTGIVKIGRKKLARESLGRLGSETLQQLLSDGLEKRIDDDKNMHLRISLSKLVKGEVRLCTRDRSEAFVKGLFKIESYPGDNHLEIITELVRSMT
jgi:RNA binding exosome subunit|tara:strand:- start:458 stop:916 length:459 start_codon:yes stop_codon:yes gene_type:complete